MFLDSGIKSECSGCTACASICPQDAIDMRPDALGFLYPVVQKEKCNDCGLCRKVCAFNESYDTSLNMPEPDAYAARHKNIKEVEASRSGAAFVAISDYNILENGSIVYGAGNTDHFRRYIRSPKFFRILGMGEFQLSEACY